MGLEKGVSRRAMLRGSASALAGVAAIGAGVAPAGAQTAGAGSDMNLAKIILGSPPGTLLDVFARRIADSIQPAYARNVVVDNRTGAGGQVAISAVKSMPADGTTILLTPSPMMNLYPFTYRKLPYDPVADFIPVAMGAEFDLAFAVGPMVPQDVKTMDGFFAWCRANPGQANFGSPATASSLHFVGSMTARAAKTDLTHVPFRGTVPAILDMVGGQVAAVAAPVGDFLPFLEGGKVRILGTAGQRRSRFAPNVPTFTEQGFKGIEVNDWFAFFVVAKTPTAQVKRLSEALKTALASEPVSKALQERGLEPRWSSPDALGARLKADQQKWEPVVKSFNFSAES